MCGIIGYVGGRPCRELILTGLERLEYRGYDSAGIAVYGRGGLQTRRSVGKLANLHAQLREQPESIGLGNTWPKRDYIDVLDAAAGFAAAALGTNRDGVACEVVNLGSGHQYSVDEILARMRAVLGLDFSVRQDPARARAVDRNGFAQPEPRPYPKSGLNAIPCRTIEVTA